MHKTKARTNAEGAGKWPVSNLGPPTIEKITNGQGDQWTGVVTNPKKYCRGRLS
jgi:hypothetical protein